MEETVVGVAALVYGLGAVILALTHLRGEERASPAIWWLVLGGFLAQGWSLWGRVVGQHGSWSMDLAGSLELVSWMMGLLFLLGWRIRRRETRSVGLLFLPGMTGMLLLSLLLPEHAPLLGTSMAPMLLGHLGFSLAAYGLFTVAAGLALMEWIQERALREKRFSPFLSVLPPLGTLEAIMFGMVRWGFVLLTMSILTGAGFSYQRTGALFHLTHKEVFSWGTWLLFAGLLAGHHVWGWRGRRAVGLTWTGYLFLALAYLGVKFVSEVILRKN
ncbi:MAG: cytochrome c biogenesis protein CcsA [Magnetococcales bacterium]|nr:cytochrome c biogenesis protein CcsA [Magnetococcales bacterium]